MRATDTIHTSPTMVAYRGYADILRFNRHSVLNPSRDNFKDGDPCTYLKYTYARTNRSLGSQTPPNRTRPCARQTDTHTHTRVFPLPLSTRTFTRLFVVLSDLTKTLSNTLHFAQKGFKLAFSWYVRLRSRQWGTRVCLYTLRGRQTQDYEVQLTVIRRGAV